ncbi:hypothetical protein ACLMJK_005746 [Lecanora helva]
MSSLPPEVRASFITIIDSILAASDLDLISEKRIRKGIQASVEYDITPQKSAIKALIMERFDKFDAQRRAASVATNGHVVPSIEPSRDLGNIGDASPPAAKKQKRETPNHGPAVGRSTTSEKRQAQDSDDDELSDVKDSPPPKKKKKTTEQDSDAAFAAKLQAQENSRMRSTRGGGAKPTPTKKKKTPKKKTSAKVKAEDDSDLEGSGSDVKDKKVNRTGGFHKELMLSPALSALLDNEPKLSRPQTVKRIWAYVRENDLQDPSDKRMIRCDDNMRAVFKQDKVHMFTMNKILSQNMYNVDE